MRVGVDVGGTFTDFVFVREDGTLLHHKVPSTPSDPGQAILNGLGDVGGVVEALVHGTTVATNAVLERKGARTALVATRGFGDAFVIGRQVRPALYDIDVPLPRPLVDAGDVVEADERLEPGGMVLRSLEQAEIERIVRVLEERGVASVALCLLFSYAAPEHESRIAEALRAAGLRVSPSFEAVREYREYERMSTCVVNAYVAPVMERYIQRLEERLPTRRFRIMQSNGGSMSPGEARRLPVHTILSGPAGGVAGAAHVGRLAGLDRFVTFDMGGTSCDVALYDDGIQVTSESSVEGYPLRVPVIDIHTVGAGGGSIARLDAGGALVVGPESAGADPGPACYGRGELPAVTDANAVLGRLSERHFLGGRMRLHVDRARRALASIAGAPVEQLAAGIVRVVNSNMERAIRVISVERGHDVRDFTLLCFGGAGGLHAVELAASLGMPRVLVPVAPGTLSALGVLTADVVKDLGRTVLGMDGAQVDATLDELEAEGRGILEREGFSLSEARTERSLEVRYAGQSYEISVPWRQIQTFHDRHKAYFGHSDPQAPLEVVNARVRIVVPTPSVALRRMERGGEDPSAALDGAISCFSGGVYRDTPIYDRDRLRAGNVIGGPAVIVELTSTTLVPDAWAAAVDDFGNLVVERL